MLTIPNFNGLTPATTPWEDKTKFSIFPKIINPTKGKYCSNIQNHHSQKKCKLNFYSIMNIKK